VEDLDAQPGVDEEPNPVALRYEVRLDLAHNPILKPKCLWSLSVDIPQSHNPQRELECEGR